MHIRIHIMSTSIIISIGKGITISSKDELPSNSRITSHNFSLFDKTSSCRSIEKESHDERRGGREEEERREKERQFIRVAENKYLFHSLSFSPDLKRKEETMRPSWPTLQEEDLEEENRGDSVGYVFFVQREGRRRGTESRDMEKMEVFLIKKKTQENELLNGSWKEKSSEQNEKEKDSQENRREKGRKRELFRWVAE